MPPTAIEIKARLDKAVDQEGNVLDMEAVLDIVASLEKIIMTKESLEATRIGKTINLMRKKTSNKDLSKRAKKLVQKWQTVVSHHLKMNGVVVNRDETENNNSSFNGGNGETPHGSPAPDTDTPTKLATKRKRSSPDICAAKQPLRAGLSPRPGVSPVLGLTQRQGLSPRVGISPKRSGSPITKAKLDNSKLKTSGLVGDHGNVCNEDTTADTTPNAQVNCTEFLKHTNNEQHAHKQQINNPTAASQQPCPSNDAGLKNSSGAPVSNSTDTRLQEDRIVLGDYISKNKCSYKGTTTTSLETTTPQPETVHEPVDTKVTGTDITSQEPTVGPFTPIEAEDLEIQRRDLPDDLLSPTNEADGVNGVYDSKGNWCTWETNIQARNEEFLLLPYVILD